jgi:hypothetical protein
MSTSRTKLDYVAPAGLGLQRGPNSEFTLIFKVKPGHEKLLREDLPKFGEAVRTSNAPFLAGLHESRLTLFDNDTRLLFSTTFDGDLDKYVDDAVLRLMGVLHMWLRHLEGYTGTMDAHPTDLNKAKEWFMGYFRTSSVYTRIYPRPLTEILKALKVNEAFQKVLDNPAAHKVLQDPALKPLLDLASE